MDLVWVIYFIDVFCGSTTGMGFIGTILTILWVAVSFVNSVFQVDTKASEEEKAIIAEINSNIWPVKVLAPLLISLAFFLPNTETAYKMLAAYGLQELVMNEKVQELGGKSLSVIEKAMDEYLKGDK